MRCIAVFLCFRKETIEAVMAPIYETNHPIPGSLKDTRRQKQPAYAFEGLRFVYGITGAPA
jgi:hypothetical protein